MLEYIILGIIQGIAEWLPVSSEGMLILTKTHFFNSGEMFLDIVKLALFLHLGTFLAALVYFFDDVKTLFTAISKFQSASKETQKLFFFLLTSTLISGTLGFVLIKLISDMGHNMGSTGKIITCLIGFLLLGTGFLELRVKKNGTRKTHDLNWIDSITLGIVQGLSVLPGFSRSGLTVSTLLLRKIDKAHALKISFLMSLPIVLAGNILLNFSNLNFNIENFVGLLCSFVFGLLTIHVLLKVAEAVNFGYFMLSFGLLTIFSIFI